MRRALFKIEEQELAVENLHALARRDYIDLVWPDRHAVLDLVDPRPRMRREQLHHLTAMIRREVLNDHESRATVRRHRREKTAQRLQSTRGSPEPHHIKVRCRPAVSRSSNYGWLLRLRLRSLARRGEFWFSLKRDRPQHQNLASTMPHPAG